MSRINPAVVGVTVWQANDGTLTQKLTDPNGNVIFEGPLTLEKKGGRSLCEEGEELLDDLEKRARGEKDGQLTGFKTQMEFQALVNRLLGSRGQRIEFES